jgi:hypothetical protein
MAISYNIQQLKSSSNAKTLLKLISYIVVAVSFFVAGFMGKGAYAQFNEHRADAACRMGLTQLMSGQAEKVYESGSDKLKQAQPREIFKEAFASSKADKGTIGEGSTEVTRASSSLAVCTYNLKNLSPNADGKTDDNFSVVLSKQGMNWKIDTIKVL